LLVRNSHTLNFAQGFNRLRIYF